MSFIIKGTNNIQNTTIYVGRGTKKDPVFFVCSRNQSRCFHYMGNAEKFFYTHGINLWDDYSFSIVDIDTNEETFIPLTKPEEVIYLEDMETEENIRYKY